ncbi:hypothetical protein LWI29_002887 [Acer saccharum]|uniref:Uncharacterized protein n=1 Tax=Acer saccharum TaxID=4024 RepID=A0AA39VFF8_ACESA|nr:hypothetical protein LWI29_002887 [Acer saccharum]
MGVKGYDSHVYECKTTAGQGCDRGRSHLDSGLNPIRSFAFLHRCRVLIGCSNHQDSYFYLFFNLQTLEKVGYLKIWKQIKPTI